MTNLTDNKQKKTVNFDNLRALSQINNVDLSKMNAVAEKMRTQVENVSKNIRECLRNREVNNTAKLKEVPVMEQKVVTENVQPVSVNTTTNQVENKNINSQNNGTRNFNSTHTATYRKPFDRPYNKPYNNSTSGDRPYNKPYNNDKTDRPFNNRPFNNTGPRTFNRPPFDKTNTTRPNQTKGPFEKKPFRQNKPETLEKAEVVLNVNTKRTFEKKKDDRKEKTFEKDNKNRRLLIRQGLMEENSISERIRTNRKSKKKVKDEPTIVAAPIDHAVLTTNFITVKQLSEKTGKSVSEILKQLMVLGSMSNLNSVIDFTTAELVCSELGVVLEQKLEKSYEEKLADEFVTGAENADDENDNQKRPPIITILGHVDHGKTTLLDYIRKSHIASGEAGGITQHISAYQIEKMGQQITFIDTPGHEAFSAMRARGASVTDIAILVVAADDGVQPQTIEAIKHIRDAKVPMIVAINKIDRNGANVERVKEQLAKYDVLTEEWGGDTIEVPVSAVTGEGIDKLLEMVLLVADMQELKANPKRQALGMVIEAKLDKGKGPIATVIILNGTLRVGDTIISGTHVGKVRAIIDDKGKNINSALPSKPISILGLDGVPNAGDQLYAVDEKMSKNVLAERKRKQQTDLINAKSVMSTEEFLAKNAEDEKRVLYLIVKTDVQGSYEALSAILNQINNEEVRVECIHGGVGGINENDVLLAKTSNAILIGFNVKPDTKAAALAEQSQVEIMQSKIIYQISEAIAKRIKSMLTPIFEEKIIGHCEVIRVFKISRIGTVAGCLVKDGKITKNSKIRLSRKGEKLVETTITTLQREKNDVREVSAGMECGIKLEGYNDILLEDTLEAVVMEQVERK